MLNVSTIVFFLMETNPKIQYFPENIVFAVLGFHYCLKTNCECKYIRFSLNGNHPKIQYFPENIVFAVVGLHFA